ncbi:MAG: cytochrome c3 family protein [Desulfovibrionales bacterium]|nr:cytochrome c3 family protein [Desulfovibrionales bacterium]
MRNVRIMCMVAIAITAIVSAAIASDVATEGADDIIINKVQGKSSRNLAVVFNHSSHEGIECSTCHHKWDDGTKKATFGASSTKVTKAPRSCASCHTGTDAAETSNWRSYFRAMHKKGVRPSCLSCHVEEFGDDKEMTGCYESACHPDGLY